MIYTGSISGSDYNGERDYPRILHLKKIMNNPKFELLDNKIQLLVRAKSPNPYSAPYQLVA
jgi:hypothetical protein